MKKVKILTITLAIILITAIAFGGIYVQKQNRMENVVEDYKYAMDLEGTRTVKLELDTGTSTVVKDSEGKEVKDTENLTEEQMNEKGYTKEEVPNNSDDVKNEENYKKAKEIDPQAIEKISKNDKKRILRILEIYHATGKNKTEQEKESRKKEVEYDYKVYALNWDREKLYERIDKRVDIMIEQGLIEEVKEVYNKYEKFPTAMQGLGYKEVVQYLENELTKEEMIEKIKQETRRYAKRQLTWFRKNKQTIWLNAQDEIQNNIRIILEGLN